MLMWINKAAFNVNFIKLMSHSEIKKTNPNKSVQAIQSSLLYSRALSKLEQISGSLRDEEAVSGMKKWYYKGADFNSVLMAYKRKLCQDTEHCRCQVSFSFSILFPVPTKSKDLINISFCLQFPSRRLSLKK